jgi:beta-galactosidase
MLVLVMAPISAQAQQTRQRLLLDFGWQFLKGEPPRVGRGGRGGGAAAGGETVNWQSINLPHDFSIEGPWAANSPAGGSGGYAPLGVGSYRRTFRLPAEWKDKYILVEFDGAFNKADVRVNNSLLKSNRYGYIGFDFDATPSMLASDGKLDMQREHRIDVRVDNSTPASRWYTGSGIYDHVWLRAVDAVHVPPLGTYITTPEANDQYAHVQIETTLRNFSDDARAVALTTQLIDPAGAPAGKAASTTVAIDARGEKKVVQTILVVKPQLWDLDTPNLYRAVSHVGTQSGAGDTNGDYESTFGIRTIKWDPTQGFVLNGRRVTLGGVDLHHDLGALGAAAYAAGYERRLRLLKDAGINAVRLAHNPHTPSELEACDRLGMLVFDECFDKWNGFLPDGTGWKDELDRFLRRDRNHPSVIIWSVGNEVGQQGSEAGATQIKPMIDLVHALDPTRPATASLERSRPGQKNDRTPWMPLPPMTRYMDVFSLNYQTVYYEKDHEDYPDKVFIGGEVTNRLSSLAPAETTNPWFRVRNQQTNKYYPYVGGQFIWAGWDYLGEAGGFPMRGSADHLFDGSGRRRPISYYVQSLYSDKPMVQISVGRAGSGTRLGGGFDHPAIKMNWNWADATDPLEVTGYTNAAQVELFLNDKSLGTRRLAEAPERVMTWPVKFEPGKLRAQAKDENGRLVAEAELNTAGAPARLELKADRTQLNASGQDLSFVFARVVDSNGVVVPTDKVEIQFKVEGAGNFVGADNGDMRDVTPYQSNRRQVRAGQALAIVGSTREPGTIRLRASVEGLRDATIEITTKPAGGPPTLD